MSRLSTRTKIAVGVGVVVCVAAWLVLRPAPPPVVAGFVRYVEPSNPTGHSVVIYVTNCTSTAVKLIGEHNVGLAIGVEPHSFSYAFAKFPNAPRQIQIAGYRLSGFRRWTLNHQPLLRKLGLTGVLFQSDFTLSIDLPPRGTNAPAQPVTP